MLIEGLPGLGKTHLAKAIAAALGLRWARVQCTPDLMPADVTGAEIYVTAAGGASIVRVSTRPGIRTARAGR
ncbi:MAG: AAA family ATPase [Burkholderiaceae bacterium]